MPKFIRWLFYSLMVFLPIQNVLVQFFVINLELPIWISLWKEVFVAIIIFYFILEFVFYLYDKFKQNSFTGIFSSQNLKIFWPMILLGVATLGVSFSTFFINDLSLKTFLYGFRFELWWVWFFVFTFSWIKLKEYEGVLSSLKQFQKNLVKTAFVGFSLVFLISIFSIFLGQENVYTALGFGKNTDGIVVESPICHRIDFEIEACRMSGGFSAPNHFAGYLLLVLPVIIYYLFKYRRKTFRDGFNFISNSKYSWKEFLLSREHLIFFTALNSFGVSLLFIVLSFARYSWLSLIFWFGFLIFFWFLIKFENLSKISFIRNFIQKFKDSLGEAFSIFLTIKNFLVVLGRLKLVSFLILPFVFGLFLLNLPPSFIKDNNLPDFLAKPSSSIWHYRHTKASLDILSKEDDKLITGYGLGTTGPSATSAYTNPLENYLIKNYPTSATNFGLELERLVIPENWFLQLAINGGLIYTLLYFIIILIPVNIKDILKSTKSLDLEKYFLEINFGFSFLSIIFGNLFLHIWENQTIALYWSLMYLVFKILQAQKKSQNPSPDFVEVVKS
jgi:hypothetical protein